MKTPIERAARALCELAGNPPGATMGGKPLWMAYLPEARAVLIAIREPSKAMLASASYHGEFNEPGETRADMWMDMVDTAIGEVPQ